MATTTTDIESRLADLSGSAFDAFCEDIGAMFDADVQCKRQQAGAGTVDEVRKLFKKLSAVHLVQATGLLDGTFPIFFDQGGLFVLSGVIVMLPEKKILEDVRRGSIDDADNLTDAAREVGNLLVGSWDRVFREECEGHGHFLKTNTFIGKPWEDPQKVGLASDEAVYFAVYEMTVGSYPSFCCAAVFPKSVIAGTKTAASIPTHVETQTQTEAPAPPAPASEALPVPVAEAPAPAAVTAPPDVATARPEPTPEIAADRAVPSAPIATGSAPTPVAKSNTEAVEPTSPQASESSEPVAPADSPQAPTETKPMRDRTDSERLTAIPEDIQAVVETVVGSVPPPPPPKAAPKPHRDSAPVERNTSILDQVLADYTVCPDNTALADLLDLPARKVMVPEVIWCDPEATVQDAISLMQQHSVGYVLVGREGVLEGLLSNSNIQGGVSPYLRPVFAKWRRPEDDATLGIKVKWIMSRPVRTVKPDAPLATIIESMCRYGGRCLPVVDTDSKVLGLITVFDVLLRVLEADQALSWKGKSPQAVPMLV